MRRGLGWRRQTLDHRDLVYAAPQVAGALPPVIDLRTTGLLPAPWDQGSLGSCTSHGVAAALQFDHLRQKHPDARRTPSRLMLYWETRHIEGSVDWDAGGEIRDAIKAAARYGTAFEDGPHAWPYDIAKFTTKPPRQAFDAALKFRAVQYRAVPQISQQIRGCLAEGFPVVFGFTVYPELDSDEVAKTGVLPMPAPDAEPQGGHCVALVGYDDHERLYIARNSWGSNWGLGGYFLMPYEMVLRPDISSDFWTIRIVS